MNHIDILLKLRVAAILELLSPRFYHLSESRTKRVNADSCHSQLGAVCTGIPQDSLLEPLQQFTLHLSDLLYVVSH